MAFFNLFHLVETRLSLNPPVEVDVFLGSLGFIRPGRESSMMRSSKRLGNEREVFICLSNGPFEKPFQLSTLVSSDL